MPTYDDLIRTGTVITKEQAAEQASKTAAQHAGWKADVRERSAERAARSAAAKEKKIAHLELLQAYHDYRNAHPEHKDVPNVTWHLRQLQMGESIVLPQYTRRAQVDSMLANARAWFETQLIPQGLKVTRVDYPAGVRFIKLEDLA